MWVRKRIDIGWRDLGYGVVRSLAPRLSRRPRWGERAGPGVHNDPVLIQWADGDRACTFLSVRTAFDALLSVLDLPARSEVLLSAVTIKDMVRIVEHHGLVPVPVDLDTRTLAPKPAAVEAALTPNSKVIVVAHLFGSRVEMDSIRSLAEKNGLFVIEDCAQSFTAEALGRTVESDAELFSFGPIKTATALGGAVARLRDANVCARLRAMASRYPRQSRWVYLARLLKYVGIKVLSTPGPLALIARVWRLFGRRHDAWANRIARGFAGRDFFRRIRQQPSEPLLELLERRLRNFDSGRLDRRILAAQRLAEQLGGSVRRPGAEALQHTHWVFPVEVDDPAAVMERLWGCGFDSTQGHSHCVVEAPSARLDLEATEAKRALRSMVFLPPSDEMPPDVAAAMAGIVRAGASSPRKRRCESRRQT